MIKIQYCSDIHLEFIDNALFMEANPIIPTGEILILAGDIIPFRSIEKANRFFDFISENFEKAYWLPGNHEYYHGDLKDRSGSFHEKIRSNIHLINNTAVEYQKVRFVFSTLWSAISPGNQWQIQQGMSDFQEISFHGNRFTAFEYNELHLNSLNFLSSEFERVGSKTVVVTHHVPTFMHYPEMYRGSILNEGFASEQFELINRCGAEYWIYGHHHGPVTGFTIGSTRLISNQLGYVSENQHMEFRNDAYFTIWH
jgi:predicted phosphohydrolase